jgi:hypothetical protein
MKSEKLAAYLDGNMDDNELHKMSDIIREHAGLREILDICDEVDADMEAFTGQGFELPDDIKDPELRFPDPSLYNIPLRGLGMVGAVANVAMCAADCAEPAPEDEDNSIVSRLKDLMNGLLDDKS